MGTDTIAAVTGGLLGAVHGIQAIPSRWTTPLTGVLPGHPPEVTGLADLIALAIRLDGGDPDPTPPADGEGITPVEVEPGLWLSDLAGATTAPAGTAVISLCRTFHRIPHPIRRQVYLTDDDTNLDIPAVLTDVTDTIAALRTEHTPVLVHCHGGASRTGLVLRAWLTRHRHLTPAQATALASQLWPATAGRNRSFDAGLEVWASQSGA